MTLNRAFLYEKYRHTPLVKNVDTLTVLFYLDVDNLKYINNLFGHTVGDMLLIKIGEELMNLKTEYPMFQVYRITGDEFVFCREGPFILDEILAFPGRIIDIFKKPFLIEQQKIITSVSVGISYYNYCNESHCIVCDGKCKKNIEQLLKEAEAAKYQVKSTGKNNYLVFNSLFNDAFQLKTSILQDLRDAVKNNELILYYQPKFNMKEQNYDSFEALVRWMHPNKGLIPPSEFIPIAEESVTIIELGNWVTRKIL